MTYGYETPAGGCAEHPTSRRPRPGPRRRRLELEPAPRPEHHRSRTAQPPSHETPTTTPEPDQDHNPKPTGLRPRDRPGVLSGIRFGIYPGPGAFAPDAGTRHGIRRAPGPGAGCSHRPQGGSELHPRPGGTRHGHGEGRTGNGPGPSPRTNSGCNSDRRFRHGPGEERSVCGTGPQGASSFHASAWNEGLVTAPAGTCPERFGPGTGASRASEAEPARDRPGTEPGPVGTGPVPGTGEERTGHRNGARATGPSPNRDQRGTNRAPGTPAAGSERDHPGANAQGRQHRPTTVPFMRTT